MVNSRTDCSQTTSKCFNNIFYLTSFPIYLPFSLKFEYCSDTIRLSLKGYNLITNNACFLCVNTAKNDDKKYFGWVGWVSQKMMMCKRFYDKIYFYTFIFEACIHMFYHLSILQVSFDKSMTTNSIDRKKFQKNLKV